MNKSPAFRFYADDFLAGTFDMSTEEVGAYIRLLCHEWNRGSTPVEPEKQQRLAGGSVSDEVRAKFHLCEDGRLRNPRLEKERQKQAEFSQKQAEKGRKSGEARRTTVEPRLNHGSTPVEPVLNLPSPFPSPIVPPPPVPQENRTCANLPTWAEVKAEADMRGVPEASARAFFDHHEGNSIWLNEHGKLKNWRHKLKVWADKDRQPKPNTNYANHRPTRTDRNAGTFNAGLSTDDIKSKVR